jgi:hypothetical protein
VSAPPLPLPLGEQRVECHGNLDDHCCYIRGEVCLYLEEGTVEGRRWSCGLFRELGSWDAVHRDARYKGSAIAAWFTQNFPGYGCGDWPQNLEPLTFGVGRCCYG